MKKFIAFMGIIWQQTLAYRGEHFVWFLLDLIPALVISNLWVFVHLQSIVYYYLVNILIERLTATHFEDWMVDEIKDGKISTYLLKPFSYHTFLAANELTWRISGLIFVIPSLFLFYPLLKSAPVPQISIYHLLLTITLLPVIFISRFCISYLIGSTAFWLDNSKALSHFKWMCEGIFGGSWLPLFMFPIVLQNFAKTTPFYYFFYFPNQLILGNFNNSEILIGLITCITWLFLLILVSSWVWRRGVRSYSAVGN